MRNNIKRIFRKRSCLAAFELEHYVRNEMSQRERNEVERHLLDCELCSDAVEGLIENNLPTDLLSLKTDLAKKFIVTKEVKSNERKIRWFMAAAVLAGLLLISAVVWQFRNRNDTQLVQALPTKPPVQKIESAAPQKDFESHSAENQSPKASTVAESQLQKETTTSEAIQTTSSDREDLDQKKIVTDQSEDYLTPVEESGIDVPPVVPSEEIMERSISVNSGNKPVNHNKVYSLNQNTAEDISEKKQKLNSDGDSAKWVQAFKLAKESNYLQAFQLLSEIRGEKHVTKLNFYKGLYQYEAGNVKAAIGYFDKAIKEKVKNEFSDHAYYYKGLALIASGNSIEGKIILQSVIEKKLPDSKRAAETLELLK